MLHEYAAICEALISILDESKSISDGSAADAIDLANIVSTADNLANAVFGGNTEYIPALMVASREAFDFVSAHSRINDVFAQTRADIYAAASEEFASDKKRVQYYDAVLKSLDRLGGS